MDSSGNVIAYDNKKHDLNSAQYQHQEKTREKKQQLIRDIQDYWNGQEKPRIKKVAEAFGIAPPTAKKIYFHDTGGYRQPGASCQLQKTRIIHERLAEYHLQNDAGRMQQ